MTKTILLAAMLAMGMSASAQDKKGNADVSFSGEYRLRYTNNLNADAAEDGQSGEAMTEGRFKLGTTFRMGEKLTGHATMLFGHQFGAGGTFGTDEASSPDAAKPDTANDTFGMYEAYANWMMADNWSLKAGRFGYQIGDGKVISIDDYQQKPNALEGVVVGWDTEWAKVNILGFEHYDFGIQGGTGDDKDASTFGVSLDWKNTPEWLKMANLHALNHATDGSNATAGENINRIGLSVGGAALGALDWGFTYATESGDAAGAVEHAGNMMDLNVGWSFADLMKLKVWAGYHTDSGNDSDASGTEEYNPFLYDTHEYAGLADVVGWGNLTDTSIGLSIEPMDAMTVSLVYHMFAATEKDGNNNILDTATGDISSQAAVDATKADIGNEIDLSVWHKYDNGMNVGARYSTFTLGERFEAPTSESYDQIWLQGSASF